MPSSERMIRQARAGGASVGTSPEPTARPNPAATTGVTSTVAGSVIRGRPSGGSPARSTTSRSLAGPGTAPARAAGGASASSGRRGTSAAGISAARASAGATALQVDLRELHQRVEDRGYAIGRGRAEAELAGAIEAAGAMAARIEAMAPRESSAVAHALATISTAIARRIVGAELHLDPTILVRALESAVAGINGSPEARVLLNPDQLGPVSVAWEAAHGNAYLGKRWTFEADASLPAGGCVLRYEHGVVAVGLEAQIDEIAAALDGVLPGLRHARHADARVEAR